MRFEVVELGPTANKVVMVGRLDSTTVGMVETPFTAAVSASGRSAVLDMRNLEFLSSLGIRLLLSAARVVSRRGGKVVLFGAQPMVAEVLTAMALDEVLPLVATEAEAVARLTG
ncbi:STAS domain-containing protein [Falsiroseomonas oryzae]|uniref:STAS domain-containing protein n=1 Tax=Falsiroseomonas oryzae TaxID=2766473 RepID=UPI0022EB06A3|nr:STAS domain-containing protein [Roseomonas sp. MO-31]